MWKNVNVTLSNEAWKYLYVVMSNVFCTNLKECEVVDWLFNVFMPTAEKYDIEFAQLKQDGQQLEQTYKIQMQQNATKVQIQHTIDAAEANEKKKEDLSAIPATLEFTDNQVKELHNYVTHILSIKRLDEKSEAPGIRGRHNIRLAKEILQELQNNI